MYPYSPKLKKNANTLKFKIPGFEFPIYIPFTGRRLAVCERCKKNFKTRDYCRTRDCHVDLPWSQTYVCVSLDPSCTDRDGKLLDGPFYARAVSPIAFHFDGDISNKTPICAPCKDKNYTRKYCRHQKKHLQLPWSTVYVILSAGPENAEDSDFLKISPSSTIIPKKRKKKVESVVVPSSGDISEGEDSEEDSDLKKEISMQDNGTGKGGDGDRDGDGDEYQIDEKKRERYEVLKLKEEEEAKKMNDIPPSRTLLASVSSVTGCTIEVS